MALIVGDIFYVHVLTGRHCLDNLAVLSPARLVPQQQALRLCLCAL